MPEEEKNNIFKEALDKINKKSAASAKNQKPSAKIHDPELDEMVVRLKKMNSHICNAFETVAREMGMTPQQLHAWFDEGSHLLPAEKQLLREVTAELNHKIAAASGDPKKLRKSDSEVEKDAKNRKAKTLGSRKNWIPIR